MNAIIGSKIIWQHKPIIKAFGKVKVRFTSLKLNESPRLNIIKAITEGNMYCEKIVLFIFGLFLITYQELYQ
jgi:hypothetical protein